jgi:hypothetical protein
MTCNSDDRVSSGSGEMTATTIELYKLAMQQRVPFQEVSLYLDAIGDA